MNQQQDDEQMRWEEEHHPEYLEFWDFIQSKYQWQCPYCGEPLPEKHSAHCGEVGHAERREHETI